jgi:hypothetical protein
MNTLIYDIEIIKAIPTKNLRIDKGMGIAVIGYQWNNDPAHYCLNTASFLDLLTN